MGSSDLPVMTKELSYLRSNCGPEGEKLSNRCPSASNSS